jgi:hypothetical protein
VARLTLQSGVVPAVRAGVTTTPTAADRRLAVRAASAAGAATSDRDVA